MLSEETDMTNPRQTTSLLMVMCHVRSLYLPDDQGTMTLKIAEKRQMKVVHKTEDPGAPVTAGLAETLPNARGFATISGIVVDSGVGELAFLFGQPAGFEGAVGQEEESEEGDENGYCALDDEEPEKS
ncbi:hypothetical protein ColLi_00270 [Colletotrichum liriopes]|uniref:Uncharacterized protein n=1 Tax=Colletotrichum liriopes TaxID=708192 RepID=A0AA37GBC5_9PEZI|nr:hypothetical protein ColLi_00270 [Colletotrichum liriopes]